MSKIFCLHSHNGKMGRPIMKLDQIALIIVVAMAVAWLVVFAGGMMQIMPYGFIVLIPLALFLWIVVRIVQQRLKNKEDDYYHKNIDK